MVPEPVLWWSAAIAVSAGVVVPYARRFRYRVAHDRERKAEASQLGIDKPAAQFPFIDPMHCIGCGACVRACPEGDVLGIVGGTAVVVNGLRCVGHGRCEEACPVGAIEVGLGDMKSREDVPLLDEHRETTVPGIFIAGELGGLSLVKNAVMQGREVIRTIASRRSDPSPALRPPSPRSAGRGVSSPSPRESGEKVPEGGMRGTLDVVIVGAGPAGLSAALEARTAGLSYVALEKEETLGGSLLHYPRRKMVLLQPVEIATSMVLKNEEYSKERLLEIFESLVATHTLDVRFDEAVMSIERDGAAFVIRTARETYRAANVILALGRRGTPRRLNIPGEELPKVMYRLMDAESYRDQRVMIVGGGDSAIEAAVGLSLQPGNVVSLSYRREKLVRIKKKNEDAFAKAVAAGRIIPLFNTQPVSIDERTVTLKRDDGETLRIENDYVFVFAGGVPPFDFLKKIGVKMGGSASVSS